VLAFLRLLLKEITRAEVLNFQRDIGLKSNHLASMVEDHNGTGTHIILLYLRNFKSGFDHDHHSAGPPRARSVPLTSTMLMLAAFFVT
jgi:hypothetical protein